MEVYHELEFVGSSDRTPIQPEANPIQGGDVRLHQLEDFGGIAAMRSVAFSVHQSPQLTGNLPAQARADQTPFDPE
jgi:hypothetical protein